MIPVTPAVFPHLHRRFTQDMVNRYGRVNDDRNLIHYDTAAARRAGFPRPIVHGALVAALLNEACRDYFGQAWIQGGRLKIAFIKPVLVEQVVVTNAQALEGVPGSQRLPTRLEVWCENEAGERVIVGEAACNWAEG